MTSCRARSVTPAIRFFSCREDFVAPESGIGHRGLRTLSSQQRLNTEITKKLCGLRVEIFQARRPRRTSPSGCGHVAAMFESFQPRRRSVIITNGSLQPWPSCSTPSQSMAEARSRVLVHFNHRFDALGLAQQIGEAEGNLGQ